MSTRFPETRWSLIQRASEESPVGNREEMGELLQHYWRPMFVHLRFKGLAEERAEDLIQDFVIEILTKNLLSIADPKKGKFRSLLLTALDRFAVSRFRYENATRRSPGAVASLDALEHDAREDSDSDASLAFERAWALDVLAESMARMEYECRDAGEDARWELFQQRILTPLLEDAPATDYEELVERFGLANRMAAMNMVVTAKRQFARVLRDVTRDYVTRSPGRSPNLETANNDDALDNSLSEHRILQQVERELVDLRDVLARTGAVSDLAAEWAQETPGIEQTKSGYWKRLTEGTTTDGESWCGLFTLGIDDSDENLAAAFDELLEFDLGKLLGLDEWSGQVVADGLSASPSDRQLLRYLKNSMNFQRFAKNPRLPTVVTNGMYFLILATAFVEHGESISGLGDTQLRAGLEWLLEQSWFSHRYRPIVTQALTKFPDQPATTS